MAFPFAANISFFFPELPWEDRIAAAAACGFTGIELNPPLPYVVPPGHFGRLLADHGLTCPLLVGPIGDGRSRFGHACIPGEQSGFRESIRTLIDYAAAADVPRIHPSAGLAPEGVARGEAEAVYVDNLAWAAEQAALAGMTLCIEPVCEMRAPGFFLQTSGQALDLINRSGRPDIGLIFDVFHVEMQEGSAAQVLPRLLSHVVHVQVSDTPDRNQPGSGRIDFPHIFGLLEAGGYEGWIGCEYRPDPGASSELDWADPWSSVPLGIRRHP
jgi:hydroxypyruvate isomerase